MRYTLHPGAELDIDEACRRYQQRASGRVIVRFLDEFERIASLLASEPGLGIPAGSGRASFPLHRFPCTFIYRPTELGIRILVVRHQHRDPEHGEARR